MLGSAWGLNKTMAQIHALLMISEAPLSTDDIIKDLGVSRGNVSMSLKALMEWGIVYKHYKPGDRKDYFYSEKDVWKLSTQVARERRRRELEPLLAMLNEVRNAKIDGTSKEQREFVKMTKELSKFGKQANKVLTKFINMEANWFFGRVLQLFA